MNVHRCLRLLSILILLLFFSCDAEIDSNETLRILGNYEAKTNVTTRYLSLKETQDIIGLLESKTGKLVSKSNSSEIETQFGTVYLDSALVALDTLGRENISFSILPDNPNPRVTFNLVVGHSEDRINRPVYLIALEKSEEYYNEEQNGISDFTNFRGKLYRYPVEDLASKSSIITSKGVCPPNDITSNPGDGSSGSGGGSGNGDSGGSPSGEGNTGSTGGSYDPCVLTVVYDRCSVDGDANGHAPQKQGDNSYCSGSPVKNIFMSGDCGFGGQSNKSSSTARGEDCPDINGPVAINLKSLNRARVLEMNTDIGFTAIQEGFLNNINNVVFTNEIYSLYYGADSWPKYQGFDLAYNIATKMTIDAYRLGKLSGPFDSQFYSEINSYFSQNMTDPVTMARFTFYFSTQCAILKIQNPDWSDTKVYWEASREVVQLLLDLGGLVPVVGEVCDITNGVIYTINGDGVNATLSFASAVPVLGWFTTGTKLAYKTASHVGAKQVLKWLVKTNGKIDFGYSNQLRKVMGNLVKTGEHAHHIIPWAVRENELVQRAAQAGDAFHINDLVNGIPVAAWRNTNHPAYSTKVQVLMDNVLRDNPNITPNEALEQLNNIIDYVTTIIKNNPNSRLQDLLF